MRPYILAFILLSTVALDARAEPALSDSATQDLIRRGIALRKAGKDEAALGMFLDLERSFPDSARVLLQIAAAAQATGQWLMAHEYLQKAARQAGDPYYQRHASEIQAVQDAVAEHVGEFRAIGTPEGAEVVIDGQVVGTLPMEAGKPIVVGSYQLQVREPGFYPLQRPVTISAGSGLTQETVELHVLRPAPSPPRYGRVEAAPAAPFTDRLSGGPWRSRFITWGLLGAGGVALATSGVAFVVRENKAGHWNDESRCLDPANATLTREQVCGDVRSEAKTAQTVGIVAGAVGLGLIGGGIVHLLSTPEPTPDAGHGRVSARCSPALTGISCEGSF